MATTMHFKLGLFALLTMIAIGAIACRAGDSQAPDGQRTTRTSTSRCRASTTARW